MGIDFSRLGKLAEREASQKYLRWFIRHNIIDDDEHADWLIFTAQVEAQYGAFNEDSKITGLWKEVYKSILFSENKFTYLIYKGDVLVRLAMASLISTGNLDETMSWLNKAQEQDRHFFKNPDYRPAYKMLSFLQPLVLFKDELWPPNVDSRKKIAGRIYTLMPLSRSKSAIAFKPDFLQDGIRESIQNDDELVQILLENVDELMKLAELCDKGITFYKSMMFIVANILEGVLFNMSCCAQQGKPAEQCENLERMSISSLARLLRRYGIINEATEYMCKYIQSYRDFIHPARNKYHKYRLDSNFNKMFLMFFILLLIDFAKGKEAAETNEKIIETTYNNAIETDRE
jgi:hypothetical protein